LPPIFVTNSLSHLVNHPFQDYLLPFSIVPVSLVFYLDFEVRLRLMGFLPFRLLPPAISFILSLPVPFDFAWWYASQILSIYHDNKAPWLSRHVLLVCFYRLWFTSNWKWMKNITYMKRFWCSGNAASISGKRMDRNSSLIVLRRTKKLFGSIYPSGDFHDRDACRRFDFTTQTRRWYAYRLRSLMHHLYFLGIWRKL
jgi:hypothetical protein